MNLKVCIFYSPVLFFFLTIEFFLKVGVAFLFKLGPFEGKGESTLQGILGCMSEGDTRELSYVWWFNPLSPSWSNAEYELNIGIQIHILTISYLNFHKNRLHIAQKVVLIIFYCQIELLVLNLVQAPLPLL